MKFALSQIILVAAVLLLSSCANKTPNQDSSENPGNLAAAFLDQPVSSEKKTHFTDLGSFFTKLLPRKTPRPPTASAVQWAGEIRMVNIAENFVLVESNSAGTTIPGGKYVAVKNGRETGVVRITSLRNPPFLIADIISGDPSPGDKIHFPKPTVPPQSLENMASPKTGIIHKWLREILPSSKP